MLLLCINCLLAQDEIISRSKLRKIPCELHIQNITAESLQYECDSVRVSLSLAEVIAYRKGFKFDPPYIFPNREDESRFSIVNGKATEKAGPNQESKKVNGEAAIWRADITLLRPYMIGSDYSDDSLRPAHKVMVFRQSTGKKRFIKSGHKMIIVPKGTGPSRGSL